VIPCIPEYGYSTPQSSRTQPFVAVHSLTHSHSLSLTAPQCFQSSFVRSFVRSFVCSVTHSLTHCCCDSLKFVRRSRCCSFVCSFLCSCLRSFLRFVRRYFVVVVVVAVVVVVVVVVVVAAVALPLFCATIHTVTGLASHWRTSIPVILTCFALCWIDDGHGSLSLPFGCPLADELLVCARTGARVRALRHCTGMPPDRRDWVHCTTQ